MQPWLEFGLRLWWFWWIWLNLFLFWCWQPFSHISIWLFSFIVEHSRIPFNNHKKKDFNIHSPPPFNCCWCWRNYCAWRWTCARTRQSSYIAKGSFEPLLVFVAETTWNAVATRRTERRSRCERVQGKIWFSSTWGYNIAYSSEFVSMRPAIVNINWAGQFSVFAQCRLNDWPYDSPSSFAVSRRRTDTTTFLESPRTDVASCILPNFLVVAFYML